MITSSPTNWMILDLNDARFANFGVTYTDVPCATATMNDDTALSATLIAAPNGFMKHAP